LTLSKKLLVQGRRGPRPRQSRCRGRGRHVGKAR